MTTPSVLEREFRTIYEETGDLDPVVIYERVKERDHPLHFRYEWDTEVAARQHVLTQIRGDVRAIKYVVVEGRADERPAFARTYTSARQSGGVEGRRYDRTSQVMADPLRSKILLSEIRRSVEQLKLKVQILMQIAPNDIRDQLREEFGDLL